MARHSAFECFEVFYMLGHHSAAVLNLLIPSQLISQNSFLQISKNIIENDFVWRMTNASTSKPGSFSANSCVTVENRWVEIRARIECRYSRIIVYFQKNNTKSKLCSGFEYKHNVLHMSNAERNCHIWHFNGAWIQTQILHPFKFLV